MKRHDFDADHIAEMTRKLATEKFANTDADEARDAQREAWLMVADEAAAIFVGADDGDFDEFIAEMSEVFEEAWNEHFKVKANAA